MKQLSYVFLLIAFSACGQSDNPERKKLLDITTDEYWKDSLTPDEFYILREQGTERAFSGKYWNFKGNGIFACRACQLPLFNSKTKYKSGTGWPSFFDQLGSNVEMQTDQTIGYSRNEIHCTRCKGHLGHVFEDGPKPSGKRYCVNSLSIHFQELK